MAENTKIEWADHTFNPWRGCTKVSAGCFNCYAEALSKRNPATLGVWGPTGTRVIASESMWRQPVKWNRVAGASRPRVFCASLADVFEEFDRPLQVDPLVTLDHVRQRLFGLIDSTPRIDWLLVTKRPQNIRDMWPPYELYRVDSGGRPQPLRHRRPNVWLLTSVESQLNADQRIPELLRCRDLAPVLGLSMEPLLGPVELRMWNPANPRSDGEWMAAVEGVGVTGKHRPVDWIIIGGESGPGARPCHLSWIRDLIQQCREAGTAVFVKQLGSHVIGDSGQRLVLKDKKGGDWSEWPEDLRIREFPTCAEVAV